MRCLKYSLAHLAIILCVANNCFAQKINEATYQSLLIKVSPNKNTAFITRLCKRENIAWNGLVKRYDIAAVTPASLLADNSRMRNWLQVSFVASSADSLKLATALKQTPFILCVQNRPAMLLPCSGGQPDVAKKAEQDALPWYITQTHIPALWSLPKKRNIIIALVDDGVRLTHKDISSHIYTNPNEIPNNNKDDDGDGFVDDVHGWDVSDNDNDVSPPENRLPDFYHGTHLAGEIALATPNTPTDKFTISIMPVKCLADNARFTYLKDGYKGIEYAIKAGANIINCSWGGGDFSQYEKDLLQVAADKNILIIASAGNYPTEKIQYPAAGKNVIAVTGLDTNNIKPHDFNYGSFVSLSAPGMDIEGANVMDDSSRTMLTGTSEATPIVTSIAALLMACYPDLKVADVERILKNSATPIDEINTGISGKLGAGLVDANKAMQLSLNSSPVAVVDTITNTQGSLYFDKAVDAKTKQHTWFIKPYGRYRGIRFYFPQPYANSKGTVTVYKNKVSDTTITGSYNLQQLPDSAFAAEDSLWVVLNATKLEKGFKLAMPYAVETVDSSCLYCSGTKVFTAPSGTFSDGSAANNYAGRQDCKWLIEAPPGKKITLEFTAFDTEPRVDFVYVFDGSETNAKILALYSGPNIPPPVISLHNKMLVWFVTSETVQGKGWEAKYSIR